jgi:hypothetical protein
MSEHQVTCIRKPQHDSTHEHITHIGNVAENWMLTREEAIHRMEEGAVIYYITDAKTGKRATVGVVREPGKHAYLRTHADRAWNDMLLNLCACGASCQLQS